MVRCHDVIIRSGIMACVKTGILFYSVLLSMSSVCGSAEVQQNSVCQPVCSNGSCITVNQDRVEFKRAEEMCQDVNGALLTLDSDTQRRLFDHLRGQLRGHFWIGLRLPSGVCSDLSLPLRGYRWSSGRPPGTFVPSSIVWNDSVRVCSPSCVSVSKDQGWTERPCGDTPHGFLCQTQHQDACRAQAVSAPYVFQSSSGCSSAPCEHECTDVKGGYVCSCYKHYKPDSTNPRLCRQYCGKQKCPALCDKDNVDICFCPDGYIKNQDVCQDIDECEMRECDQTCLNTFGSYECSCAEGFVLRKDKYSCASADTDFTMTTKNPAANNSSLKSSSAAAGDVLWIWVFTAGAVVVLIFVIRFYVTRRQKRQQQSAAAAAAAQLNMLSVNRGSSVTTTDITVQFD